MAPPASPSNSSWKGPTTQVVSSKFSKHGEDYRGKGGGGACRTRCLFLATPAQVGKITQQLVWIRAEVGAAAIVERE